MLRLIQTDLLTDSDTQTHVDLESRVFDEHKCGKFGTKCFP